MQMYWNKRKRLHKKRVQLPEDWFGTPTWPPLRHVKTLYTCIYHATLKIHHQISIKQTRLSAEFFCKNEFYLHEPGTKTKNHLISYQWLRTQLRFEIKA